MSSRTPFDVIEEDARAFEDEQAANDVADEGPRVRVEDEGHATRPKPRAGDVLANLAAANAEFWRDRDEHGFATIQVDGAPRHVRIASPVFKSWLLRLARQHTGRGASASTLAEAILALEGECLDRPSHDTHLRTAPHGGDLWIDLGDETGEAVHVSTHGWHIASASQVPVRFLRPKALRPLPRPVADGSIEELRPFLNTADNHGFVLCVAWLVAALRPGFPFPLAVFAGEQGSGKSTASRVLRSFVDPNAAMIRSTPKDEEGLFVAAQNAHVLALDNLSGCPPWLSDGLCRIATGGGFAKRALYTDGDEAIIDVRRPIILNGIDDMLARADLADRSLRIELVPLEDDERREESAFWHDFEQARGRIFGALLSGVAGAIANINNVTLPGLPRMADFARWATAAEPALGLAIGAVTRAMTQQRAETMAAVVDASLVASAVVQLLEREDTFGRWEGTPSALLAALADIAGPERYARTWPKTARGLTAQLVRVRPALRELGVMVESRKSNGVRSVALQKRVEE